MNKKILYLMILVCYGFSIQIVNSQVTQVSSVMAQYEDAFFSKIESISTEYNNEIRNLNSFYIETLQKYMQVMQSRGELYEVKAAQEEIARFNSEKILIAKNVNKEFDSLKKVQLDFIDKLETINYDRSKEIVDIYNRIISALDKYKEHLTKDGNINDAQWVDEKRKEFEISRVYKQAQTSVKMYKLTHDIEVIDEPETPVAESQPTPLLNNEVLEDAEEPSEVVVDPAIHGAIELHFSKTFPDGHIKEYKRIGLSTRTDLNSAALSVSGYCKDLDDEEKGTWQWAKKFRFQINSITSKKDYNNCFIVVQYFGTARTVRRSMTRNLALNSRIGSNRTTIRSLGFQIVQIPTPLTNSRIFLDMPTFPEIEAEPWNTTSYLSLNDINHNDFYGIIVSIYDEDNSLIYQKCSVDGLRSMARNNPPIDYRNIREPQNFKITTAPFN
jgi:hypothetical protein